MICKERKSTHKTKSSAVNCSKFAAMTSSVIYYSTELAEAHIQNEIYLFEMTKRLNKRTISFYCMSNINVSSYKEWYWKVWLKPWCLRVLAVILAILSVALIWSEVTFFIVRPRLSLFAIFLYEAQEGYFYFYVEV